ncbi:MAG: TolC family protein [Rikenellaceae bacterium]
MIKRNLLTLLLSSSVMTTLYAQHNFQFSTITLEQAIEIAHVSSPNALMAQLTYMSDYWSYRSYKAQFLPSLNLSAGVGNYDRSLVEVRNTDTGEISFVANNSLSNSLSVSIDQNIALTGGTISLNTDVVRLDQFDYSSKTYTTNPLTLSYNQPIRGFNTLKWEKKTAPREYENSKREYLETMEGITLATTQFFFNVLSAQSDYEKAVDNYKDTERLYEIAKKRYEITTVTKSDLLQLELSMVNAKMAINTYELALNTAKFNFTLYLGIASVDSEKITLVAPSSIPSISLKADEVLEKAYTNSSHRITQELAILYAEQTVAEAKADRGVQITLNANLGFSQSAATIKSAYSSLIDREIVGITLSVPIYDWGMSRGQVKMAQAQERLTRTQSELDELEFVQDIRVMVMQFNNQISQCENAELALSIANERYQITTKRFENGTITVTELNTAIEEKDDALTSYISELETFWESYYEIQQVSLYNYIQGYDISAEFDKLIEQ